MLPLNKLPEATTPQSRQHLVSEMAYGLPVVIQQILSYSLMTVSVGAKSRTHSRSYRDVTPSHSATDYSWREVSHPYPVQPPSMPLRIYSIPPTVSLGVLCETPYPESVQAQVSEASHMAVMKMNAVYGLLVRPVLSPYRFSIHIMVSTGWVWRTAEAPLVRSE